MVRRSFRYLLVVIFSLYLFFMYNGRIFTGLLILELIYPVCSFIFLHSIGNKVSVRFGRFPSMGERGERFRGQVIIENQSRFQSVRYCVRLRVNHHFSKTGPRQKLTGTLSPLEKQTQIVTLESQYAGMMDCGLETLILYDIPGIFYRKIPLRDRRFVGIMPPFELVPMEITQRTRDFLADADEHSTQKKGDDPDDIYQIPSAGFHPSAPLEAERQGKSSDGQGPGIPSGLRAPPLDPYARYRDRQRQLQYAFRKGRVPLCHPL